MEQAAKLRRSARLAYKGGDFPTAVQQYALLFADPDGAIDPALEAQDRVDQGSALIKCSRVADGASSFGRAVAVAPTDVRARVKYGQTLSRLERHAEAAEQFRAAVGLEPEDADHHAALGAELRWTGQTEEARRHLEAALGIDPDHVDARLTLLALGRPRDAGAAEPVLDDAPPLGGFSLPTRAYDDASAVRPIRAERRPASLIVMAAFAVVLVVAGIWVRSLFP